MNIPPFFIQLAQRLFSKTPNFFKVLRAAGAIAAIVAKLPDGLAAMNITVPDFAGSYVRTAVMVAGLTMAFVAQLTVPNPAPPQLPSK